MKLLISLTALLTTFFAANAQLTFNQSLKLGLSRVGLDAPDAIANRLDVQYNRQLRASRLAVGARAGYLRTTHASILPTVENRRSRKTLDLTLGYDLLKSRVHRLAPGFGLSAWHRDDAIVRQASFNQNPDGSIDVMSFTTGGEREINFGPYFSLEYEVRLLPNVSLGAHAGLNNLGRAGWNSVAGIMVGYHFR